MQEHTTVEPVRSCIVLQLLHQGKCMQEHIQERKDVRQIRLGIVVKANDDDEEQQGLMKHAVMGKSCLDKLRLSPPLSVKALDAYIAC